MASNPGRAKQVAEALELDGTLVSGEEQRIQLLRRFRHSAGVTVYVGPIGAPFWLAASVEVKVRIVPDGTDLRERLEPGMEWALQAVGLDATEAKGLASREKPPTARHGRYAKWRAAESLLAEVLAPGPSEAPIIHSEFEAEAVYEDDALRLLDVLRDANPALDWEWDTETLEPHGLGIATEDRNWYVPVLSRDYSASAGFGQQLRAAVANHVRSAPSCWHNGKADLQTQYISDPAELAGKPLDDTILMAYILGETTLGLKELSRGWLNRDPLDWPGSLAQQPLDIALRYAGAGDARNTFDLRRVFTQRLQQYDPKNVYRDIERPVMPIVASMEKYGIPVDPVELQALTEAFTAMEEGLRSMWWARTHYDIAKDADLRKVVELYAGYDPGTVRADVLARYEGDWMDSLIGYRRVRHRRRSFLTKHLERWVAAGYPKDFRGYSSFNQAGSSDEQDGRSFKRAPRSGRFSSSGDFGNLQNQPGGEATIRSMFVAPPGDYLWWSYDYGSLEMVIAAAISQDPVMLERLRAGVDMHSAFQQDILARTGLQIPRVAAKRGNFNAQYGGYADTLGKQLQKERVFLPREDLVVLADTHRETFSTYYEYGKRVIREAKENGGYSETLFGRRRYDMDIFSGDDNARGHAERALVNHCIQGTAADIVKRAMYLINPVVLGLGAHIAIQVHDEIAGWVPVENAEALQHQIPLLMTAISIPGLQLQVSGGVGKSWEGVHD